MATKNENNSLGYTDVTWDTIEAKLNSVIDNDERFRNVSQSAIFKVIVDNFVAMADLVNYYIERTAEESFLASARHLSSVIVGAKQLGYVPKRPVGAQASVSIELSNPDLSNVYSAGDVFKIDRRNATATFQGFDFVFLHTYVYSLTGADATILNSGSSIILENAIPEKKWSEWCNKYTTEEDRSSTEAQNDLAKLTEPITIVQGEKKELTLWPGILAGRKWQTYKIDDPNFSNLYGNEDPNDPSPAIEDGSIVVHGEDSMTRVCLVNAANGVETELHVNRRSLTVDDWNADARELLENQEVPLLGVKLPVCLIESNRDTTVNVSFGDDSSTILGPKENETVVVRYLTTQGTAANMSGVAGKTVEINLSGSYRQNIPNTTWRDFPGELNVRLVTDLRGGSDFEEIQSIKNGAPGIFQALDRLVTRKDYESCIKGFTSPIHVRFATAWGESEECRRTGKVAIPGLMNCALVCAMGNPYGKGEDGHWKTLIKANAPVNAEDDVSSLVFVEGTGWRDLTAGYLLRLYIQNSVTSLLNWIDNWDDQAATANVQEFTKQLDKKSQLTVVNVYSQPIVHFFKLVGKIVLERYCDMERLKLEIRDAVYEWLSANQNFGSPVMLSNIISVVESFPEVKQCSLRFVPNLSSDTPSYAELGEGGSNVLYVNAAEHDSGSVSQMQTDVRRMFREYVEETMNYVQTGQYTYGWTPEKYVYNKKEKANVPAVGNPEVFENSLWLADGFSMRSFMENFMRKFYEYESTTSQGQDWENGEENVDHYMKAMMSYMENAFCRSMIDEDGNIVKFSMDNEMAIVDLDADQEGLAFEQG